MRTFAGADPVELRELLSGAETLGDRLLNAYRRMRSNIEREESNGAVTLRWDSLSKEERKWIRVELGSTPLHWVFAFGLRESGARNVTNIEEHEGWLVFRVPEDAVAFAARFGP